MDTEDPNFACTVAEDVCTDSSGLDLFQELLRKKYPCLASLSGALVCNHDLKHEVWYCPLRKRLFHERCGVLALEVGGVSISHGPTHPRVCSPYHLC